MQLAYDLRFRILAPALVKAIGVKIVELPLTIVSRVVLLAIFAGRPILRLWDAVIAA